MCIIARIALYIESEFLRWMCNIIMVALSPSRSPYCERNSFIFSRCNLCSEAKKKLFLQLITNKKDGSWISSDCCCCCWGWTQPIENAIVFFQSKSLAVCITITSTTPKIEKNDMKNGHLYNMCSTTEKFIHMKRADRVERYRTVESTLNVS